MTNPSHEFPHKHKMACIAILPVCIYILLCTLSYIRFDNFLTCELSRKWGFGRKVQKGHTKGHKGQGQFGLADENVANDPGYHHAKL